MATSASINAKIKTFSDDMAIAHLIVHGSPDATVQTDGGRVKTLAKVIRDLEDRNQEVANQIIATITTNLNKQGDTLLANLTTSVNSRADVVLADLNNRVNTLADGILANARAAQAAAEAAKTAAESAKTAAKTSETNAKTSETNAAASKTAAAQSATNAANSATSAGSSATSANTSATQAATSAGTAVGKATQAIEAADAAGASEEAAAISATAASNSAKAAAAAVQSSATSATEAGNSQIAAKQQADLATTKASAAAASATAAAGSATAAGTSATAAASSETKAKTSETNAKTSETNAANSASAAYTNAQGAVNSGTTATTKASEAAASATAAAGSATTAATEAGKASASATNAMGYRDTAGGHANTASTKANDASNYASSALASRNAASNSEATAKKWADSDWNVAVEAGKYSAKHWAMVAEKMLTDGVFDNTVTSDVLSWTSSKIAEELAKKSENNTTSRFLGTAAKADILSTARTIGISGGITAEAADFDGSKNITIKVNSVDASLLTGTASLDTVGNAGTANKLKTARKINGTSFDGSTDISVQWSVDTIPSNADLNNYKSPGVFAVLNDSNAATIVSSPTTVAFSLSVVTVAANVIQTLIESRSANRHIYSRVLIGTVWSAWDESYTSSNPQVDISGNAATVTNGVYTTGTQTVGGNKTFSGNNTHTGSNTVSGTTTHSGALKVTNTTASTSTTTGALTVSGGLGVAGAVYAGSFNGPLTGNASTATKLATPRTINGVNFDGSANITIVDATKAPLASPSLSGTPLTPTPAEGNSTTQIANAAFVQSEIQLAISRLMGGATPAALDTLAELAAALGGDGNFAATVTNNLALKFDKAGGNITGSVNITDTTPATSKTTGAQTIAGGLGVSGDVWATNFRGALVGNASTATALATARSFSLTGAATAAAVNFNGSGNVALNVTSLDASKLSGTASVSTTGNAQTATALAVARLINGVNFDGSANIDIQWEAQVIADATDLNNVQAEGVYYVSANASAATLLNSPTTNAFSLRVYRAAGVIQELTEYLATGSRKTYQRAFYSSAWSAWARIYTTIDAPTSVTGNAGTATKLATARALTIGAAAAKNFDGTAALSWTLGEIGAADAGHTHSDYLPINGSVRMTGRLGIAASAGAIGAATGSVSNLEVIGVGGASDAAFMTFHRPGSYAGYFGIDTNNKWSVGGWSMGANSYALFHEGNLQPSVEKLATARTIGGVSFDGTANINLPGVNTAGNQSTTGNAGTATTLATARTLTIGGTGKTFNGSANVSWSLGEIGAAPATHSHDYMPTDGGNFTGRINLPTFGNSWIAGTGGTSCSIGFTGASTSGSFHAWMAQRTAGGNGFAVGQIGESWVLSFATAANINANTNAATQLITATSGGVTVGGEFWATGNNGAYSDSRIKANFKRIDNPLTRVRMLEGMTFDRLDIQMGRQAGLRAQQVRLACPEAVSELPAPEHMKELLPDGRLLAVNYGALSGLYVEAIKELEKQLLALRREVAQLKQAQSKKFQ